MPHRHKRSIYAANRIDVKVTIHLTQSLFAQSGRTSLLCPLIEVKYLAPTLVVADLTELNEALKNYFWYTTLLFPNSCMLRHIDRTHDALPISVAIRGSLNTDELTE